MGKRKLEFVIKQELDAEEEQTDAADTAVSEHATTASEPGPIGEGEEHVRKSARLDDHRIPGTPAGKLNYYSMQEDIFLIDALTEYTNLLSKEIGISGFWVVFSQHYNSVASRESEEKGFHFVERNKDSLRRRFNRVYKRALELEDDGNEFYAKARALGSAMELNTARNKHKSMQIRPLKYNMDEDEEDDEEEDEGTLGVSGAPRPAQTAYKHSVSSGEVRKPNGLGGFKEPLEIVLIRTIHAHFERAKRANPVLQELDRIKVTLGALQELKSRFDEADKQTLLNIVTQYSLGIVEADDEKRRLRSKINELEKGSGSLGLVRALKKENKFLKSLVKKGREYKYKYKYRGEKKKLGEKALEDMFEAAVDAPAHSVELSSDDDNDDEEKKALENAEDKIKTVTDAELESKDSAEKPESGIANGEVASETKQTEPEQPETEKPEHLETEQLETEQPVEQSVEQSVELPAEQPA